LWCPKHVEQAIRSAIKTSVASSWHFISTYEQYCFPLCNSLQWARTSSLSRLHDHTRTHNTRWDSSGRVISPMRRTLPHTTNNIHSRETFMPPAGFEPVILARERQQVNALDGAVTSIGGVGSIDLRNVK